MDRAIRSFPPGSSAASYGLRPQNLLELIQSRENGKALLTAITAFVNILLDCHAIMISAIFYLGENLMRSIKEGRRYKNNSYGYILRKFAAKCTAH